MMVKQETTIILDPVKEYDLVEEYRKKKDWIEYPSTACVIFRNTLNLMIGENVVDTNY